jgi:copper chaperone
MCEKIIVNGMSCNHCVKRIKERLNQVDSINNVEIDLINKVVKVDYDNNEITIIEIQELINDLGYEVQK